MANTKSTSHSTENTSGARTSRNTRKKGAESEEPRRHRPARHRDERDAEEQDATEADAEEPEAEEADGEEAEAEDAEELDDEEQDGEEQDGEEADSDEPDTGELDGDESEADEDEADDDEADDDDDMKGEDHIVTDDRPRPMEVLREARAQLAELTGMTAESVSSFAQTEDGWSLEVEVLELERVPDTMSLMATYQVELDPEGQLTGYRRVRRYERGRADAHRAGGR